MQRKRTASLPIFNRGKRPRQAPLTHPNNADAGSLVQQKQNDGHWNKSSQYYGQTQQGHGQPRYSSYHNIQPKSVTTNTPAPRMPERTGGYNQSQSNKENLHTATSFRPFRGSRHTDVPAPGPSRHSYSHAPTTTYNSSSANRGTGFTPHNSSSNHPGANSRPPTLPTGMARSFSPAPSSAVPAPGKAVEPSKHQSAKLEPSFSTHVPVQKSSHLPRLLTATAKGMEHWGKYKSHMPMMFEIFGTLNSAVVGGPLNSREFSVQTRDGTLRCLYWEMDTTLPHLVRGKPLRVVGSWDESQQWVKCHCVREASQQEIECTDQLVAVCDTTMREAVARLPEL